MEQNVCNDIIIFSLKIRLASFLVKKISSNTKLVIAGPQFLTISFLSCKGGEINLFYFQPPTPASPGPCKDQRSMASAITVNLATCLYSAILWYKSCFILSLFCVHTKMILSPVNDNSNSFEVSFHQWGKRLRGFIRIWYYILAWYLLPCHQDIPIWCLSL